MGFLDSVYFGRKAHIIFEKTACLINVVFVCPRDPSRGPLPTVKDPHGHTCFLIQEICFVDPDTFQTTGAPWTHISVLFDYKKCVLIRGTPSRLEESHGTDKNMFFWLKIHVTLFFLSKNYCFSTRMDTLQDPHRHITGLALFALLLLAVACLLACLLAVSCFRRYLCFEKCVFWSNQHVFVDPKKCVFWPCHHLILLRSRS